MEQICFLNVTEKTFLSDQQKYFFDVYATKFCVDSTKFRLFEQNILLGQQKKFCCPNFVLSPYIFLDSGLFWALNDFKKWALIFLLYNDEQFGIISCLSCSLLIRPHFKT